MQLCHCFFVHTHVKYIFVVCGHRNTFKGNIPCTDDVFFTRKGWRKEYSEDELEVVLEACEEHILNTSAKICKAKLYIIIIIQVHCFLFGMGKAMVWGTATHISGNIGNIHMSMVFFPLDLAGHGWREGDGRGILHLDAEPEADRSSQRRERMIPAHSGLRMDMMDSISKF